MIVELSPPAARPREPSARWPAWLAPVLLVLAIVLAYAPAAPAFFVSDDFDMLAGDASDLFSPASGFGRFMPVAASAHHAAASLSGLDPLPPHLFQLGLHVACALLVAALARTLGASVPAAWLAALLWALYPRHHQVVMWFGAIAIGLAGAFSLAALVSFAAAWRTGRARLGWLAVLCYALALLAHESAVVLPLLAAVLARALPGCAGHRWPRPLPAWLWAALAIGAAHLVVLAWAYRVRAALYPDSGYRFLGLGADLLLAPMRYAAWLAVPPPWTEPLAGEAAGIVLGSLALGGAALWAWRAPATRSALAWLALAAAPAVLFGIYGVTDRYYYLPTVGLALALAPLLAARRWRLPATAAYTLLAGALLLWTAAEWRAAGATTRVVVDDLAAWAARQAAPPRAILFVAVPFKRDTTWPGSQVYVFSTGVVGAAHLATGQPDLRVSYMFADEHPDLAAWLAALPPAPAPAGLHLFSLALAAPADETDRLEAALPTLAGLKWRGSSRLPVDLESYLR